LLALGGQLVCEVLNRDANLLRDLVCKSTLDGKLLSQLREHR
jgi:hypothetical protein